MQDKISLEALPLLKMSTHGRTYVVAKKRTPTTRFAVALREYLKQLVAPEKVKPVAVRLGISQGHLNDQVTGKKPTTLDTIDLLARMRGKSATQTLSELVTVATGLDKDRPGWDAVTDGSPVPMRVEDVEALADELERQSQGEGKSPAQAKRGGKRR